MSGAANELQRITLALRLPFTSPSWRSFAVAAYAGASVLASLCAVPFIAVQYHREQRGLKR